MSDSLSLDNSPFCPFPEPPTDTDGNRERRLSQVNATIFTFQNWKSSGDALNRWLYCRVLDNTCRELGISPDMADAEIVEILRARNLPFGRDPAEFDMFDCDPKYSLLPESHPISDTAALVAHMRARLGTLNMIENGVAEESASGVFHEMGRIATSHDWRLNAPAPEELEDFYEDFRESHRAIDPAIIEGMKAATSFFSRLLACIAAAAYLRRFSGRAEEALTGGQ